MSPVAECPGLCLQAGSSRFGDTAVDLDVDPAVDMRGFEISTGEAVLTVKCASAGDIPTRPDVSPHVLNLPHCPCRGFPHRVTRSCQHSVTLSLEFGVRQVASACNAGYVRMYVGGGGGVSCFLYRSSRID